MNNYSQSELTLAATTVRVLAAEAVEKAKSGHPGMPLGTADLGVVLWLKHLRYNPANPGWINRDRFVLSNGHGSMLLYALLHLAGYELSIEDIKKFRQLGSRTPGHPEVFHTPGVEATTGPLGQGISNAVGMAIAERCMAHDYNTEAFRVVNHNIWCMAGDGCLMEGISSEAASLAGHLGLGNLKVIYDDNHISIAGHTDLSFSEDVLMRYRAYGWHTIAVDGHDYEGIDHAYSEAERVTDRPTIIAARTTIGKGSPNKADSAESHGSPLGKSELESTKKALGWTTIEEFFVPSEVYEIFKKRRQELEVAYDSWTDSFLSWKATSPELASQMKAQLEMELPSNLEDLLVDSISDFLGTKPVATRKPSSLILQAAAKASRSLIGGSADLEPSTLTVIKTSSEIAKDSFSGRNIHFGVREHAMGAIMNGLSLYGGFFPFGSTFLVFVDYMRPAIRLAALSKLRGLFIFTHDSVFVGEDGPTHQPIEHIASLRVIPNLWVIRPANALETAVAYALALRRKDGPVAMILSRQEFAQVQATKESIGKIRQGAYTVYERRMDSSEAPLVFVATGSEVALAMQAAIKYEDQRSVRVVSMPCWEIFREQPAEYRQDLIPYDSLKVVIEAGSTFGWSQMIESDPQRCLLIGVDHFGASAPCQVLAEKFGLTAQSVIERVGSFLDGLKGDGLKGDGHKGDRHR